MKRTNTETVINVINETKTTKSSANVGSVVAVSFLLSAPKPNEKPRRCKRYEKPN